MEPVYIDISANRKAMNDVTENGIYGNMSEMIQTQTSFAIGGAVIGYMWSVGKRTNWMPATFGGLLLGALLGWGVASFKKENS